MTAYPAVTFEANGGTGTTATQYANTPTALTTNGFAFAGCAFTGWNTVADGSGTSYAPGAIFSFSSSITLYAQWQGTDGQACSAVLGNPQSRADAAAAAALAASKLATTGFSTFAPIIMGAALLAGGAGLLILRRRTNR